MGSTSTTRLALAVTTVLVSMAAFDGFVAAASPGATAAPPPNPRLIIGVPPSALIVMTPPPPATLFRPPPPTAALPPPSPAAIDLPARAPPANSAPATSPPPRGSAGCVLTPRLVVFVAAMGAYYFVSALCLRAGGFS